MTTITKERLLTIKQWRETYGPGSNVVLPAEEAEELARIALASLDAKPIGAFHIAEQQVDGTSDYLKDGEWPIDNGIIEVYAAPPVPVVPEEKPMPNALSMLEREITQLIGDAQEATVTGYELIAEAWRLMDGQDPKTSDWHSKASKYLNSNIVEKVDDDRIDAIKAVLRRLAGNYPDIPDSSVPAPGKGVTGERIRIKPHVYRELVNRLHDTAIKCAGTQQLRERISRVLGDVITPYHHKQAEKSGLERCHLEAALNIKPGHTLGIIDALLVHKMARALLSLVDAGDTSEGEV
ncbi:hypothetical protein BHF58_03855 [Escherichia coli]|jgi:hypothetical protein|uniref:Uncharacterized protein n=1 Tax=Escherichia coli TaxID=562 RepID=A0A6G5ZX89_ECOLX|nr:hypothetical protein [Escherichia coli]ELF05046.1 hypothetical protein A1Y7_04820 [Escherichia coli KTE119]EHO8330157.1 hypothetical protein [Escherichia coli]EHW5830500.1 hypothetical protein [Escherichia coli]EJI7532865.1 hypothetical protein [Escherichia coli]EJQ0089816.1 hypothetical protein [Escherichia coli]